MIVYNEFIIDCNATKIHIDLTGGWKSALLLYLCAKDISENQSDKTSIVPCTVKRINRFNVNDMDRPNAVETVKKQIAWINNKFPNVTVESLITIDADVWWFPILSLNRRSLDVSEKAMLRHVYETCINKKVYNVPDFVLNAPMVKSFNAYCKDKDISISEEKNPYFRKKIYETGITIETQYGESVSLCDGNVIALRPFADTTKTNLVSIAKNLHIFDELIDVSYTCEQNTVEYKDPCGICFNCLQMKRALDNYDQNA